MTQTEQISILLKKFFMLKQESKVKYSLRALARDMKISPSHLSGVFNGKKKLSIPQLNKIFKILDIDRETQSKIIDLYARHNLGTLQKKYLPSYSHKNSLLKFSKLGKSKISLLSQWYLIPILELISIAPHISSNEISQKLGITIGMTDDGLKTLLNLQVIKKENNCWIRNVEKIRLAASSSKPEIRNFHSEMIQKSQAQLRKTDEESFSLRLITGITVGADPEKIEHAKSILNDAIHRASEILNTENCVEVYQINLQLFPLTRPIKSK